MQRTAISKLPPLPGWAAIHLTTKTWLIMKLTLFFLLIASLYAGAKGHSQAITLSERNTPLQKVFKKIEVQSGYSFLYRDEWLKDKKISVEIKNATLEQALSFCFKDQNITYEIIEKMIIIKPRPTSSSQEHLPPKPIEVKGKVTNEEGHPVAGVTLQVKGTSTITVTDVDGTFALTGIDPNSTIVLTGAETETQEIRVNNRTFLSIKVRAKVGDLDQVMVQGYGTTTRRFSTGNITRVSGDEIARQPVSNPLAALQGRVPGMIITQTSGISGSAFSIQIQGQQSINSTPVGNNLIVTNDPFIVVDGVPFTPGNQYLNQISSAAGNPVLSASNAGGLSPLNLINPADIESIEVLRDADATSIYGSRGANGVILITTKKGQSGKTKFSANVYRGSSRVTRTMEMLNTEQYLQMRREAIANEGAVPNTTTTSTANAGYAPDLLLWDTTQYTDWKKELIGGTAGSLDAQVSLSGGNANTNFLAGIGYHRETTVFPGNLYDKRASAHFSLNHTSTNRKLIANIRSSFAVYTNNITSTDLSSFLDLPPFTPSFFDQDGNLKWNESGVRYALAGIPNPFGYLFKTAFTESNNLNVSSVASYQLAKGLLIRANIGYNTVVTDEFSKNPISSQDPALSPSGSSIFGNSSLKGWNLEPQLEYTINLGSSRLNMLIGSTFNETKYSGTFVQATGYTSDELLGSIGAGGDLYASSNWSEYRYAAIFGRINYNWKKRYILNLSGRRDGSSRFGPGNQFANFGAIGAAWIFSETKYIQASLPFISYGKFRISYGTTGNDQIGNYQFLSTWTNALPYNNSTTLYPSRLSNAEFGWEINRKFQGALELGLFKDKILISAGFYRNRSSNQLVTYPLPAQVGATSLAAKNLPALIQNWGGEFSLSTKNISGTSFSWTTSGSLTLHRNRLISYPGLAQSPYRSVYVEGKPLNLIYILEYLGIDPTTGLYQFNDLNGDGAFNQNDYVVMGDRTPRFYGGIQNDIRVRNFQLNVFVEYRKQIGRNYLSSLRLPGRIGANQPVAVLDRWQKPGDITSIQRYSAARSGSFDATAAYTYLGNSNAIYSDASFIRIKNIALSYTIPEAILAKMRIESARIYMNLQNPVVFTKYKGSDPETQNLYRLPPMRTIVAGIQLNF